MADSVEARVKILEVEFREIKGTCVDIGERLIRIEETLKNNKDNTVDFKTYNTSIIEMSSSIRMLTDKMGEVIEKLDKQDKLIRELEIKDGEKSKRIVNWALTTVGALVVGYIFAIVMMGGA